MKNAVFSFVEQTLRWVNRLAILWKSRFPPLRYLRKPTHSFNETRNAVALIIPCPFLFKRTFIKAMNNQIHAVVLVKILTNAESASFFFGTRFIFFKGK